MISNQERVKSKRQEKREESNLTVMKHCKVHQMFMLNSTAVTVVVKFRRIRRGRGDINRA